MMYSEYLRVVSRDSVFQNFIHVLAVKTIFNQFKCSYLEVPPSASEETVSIAEFSMFITQDKREVRGHAYLTKNIHSEI